jgi:predicted AlkP superfamily pyrophosphatase or phosphodiesterase
MTKHHLIIHIAILILCLVRPLWAGEDSNIPGEAVGSGGQNAPAQADKPYVILISIDGYRWDYPDLYPTPTIRKLIENGTRADSVLPVFPTLTFPNHYSIATGLYPEHHGLVGNIFPNGDRDTWYVYKQAASVQDGDWYGGEPIWVTAEKQGMVSAAYFFVGTEADISGVHPSHWKRFSKDVGGEARVDQVLSWLAEPAITRPHMITLYFEDVDDHAHWYSPDSAEVIESIRRVDSYLSRLIAGISTLPVADHVNIVLVSDHGQMSYVEAEPFILDQHVNLENTDIIEGGSFVTPSTAVGEMVMPGLRVKHQRPGRLEQTGGFRTSSSRQNRATGSFHRRAWRTR